VFLLTYVCAQACIFAYHNIVLMHGRGENASLLLKLTLEGFHVGNFKFYLNLAHFIGEIRPATMTDPVLPFSNYACR